MTIVPENQLNNLFENLVTGFVKDNLESIMRAEIQAFMSSEEAGSRNSRNGYYTRNLHTKYGNVEDLEVPRDRQGRFQTELFEPYQRRDGWLEEAVIQMYKSGMGTRDVARFIESMFGSHYSPTSVILRRQFSKTFTSGRSVRCKGATPSSTWTDCTSN